MAKPAWLPFMTCIPAAAAFWLVVMVWSPEAKIKADKRADLLLLEADPLKDIGNIRALPPWLLRGRLLARLDIDRITSSHRRPLPH
jgi:hypothetical protein